MYNLVVIVTVPKYPLKKSLPCDKLTVFQDWLLVPCERCFDWLDLMSKESLS